MAEARSGGSPRRTILIILGIAGAGALLMILVCAGVVYWGVGMFTNVQQANVTANVFLDDLAAGRIDRACEKMAPTFRARTNSEHFRSILKRYPIFTERTRRSTLGMRAFQRPTGVQAVIQMNLVSPRNSLSLVMSLVKVNRQWRVESLNLP
jgi:hypothetical protein